MSDASIVTIYHQVDGGMFREFDAETSRLELAYAYVDEAWDDEADTVDPTVYLERVFRQNNAVDGTEINVQKNKRSLSVGDVVGLPNDTYFTVSGLGWNEVSEIDVGLAQTSKFYEDDAGLCPRCGDTALRVPLATNALSRTTREEGDTPVYVCSDCGTDEALEDWHLPGGATPQSQWPVLHGFDSPRWRAYQQAQEMAAGDDEVAS